MTQHTSLIGKNKWRFLSCRMVAYTLVSISVRLNRSSKSSQTPNSFKASCKPLTNMKWSSRSAFLFDTAEKRLLMPFWKQTNRLCWNNGLKPQTDRRPLFLYNNFQPGRSKPRILLRWCPDHSPQPPLSWIQISLSISKSWRILFGLLLSDEFLDLGLSSV